MGFVRGFSTSSKLLVPTFRIATVGSGPAGFYTAYHILKKSPKDKYKVQIDFFERLPAPYGLSRYGVAPDHPEVKNCEEYMDELMESGDVRFFGNVNVGKDISIKELEEHYHSVIFSYGCVNADPTLPIPGNNHPGVFAARQVVNWYNGHPDFHSKKHVFSPPQLDKVENITIIGNGNVALDVARVLLADPENHWSPTDICSEAVELLKKSTLKNVNIVARRGLLESAFTNKEIRELLELSNDKKVKFVPIDDYVYDAIEPFTKKLDRVNKRRLSILDKYSKPTDFSPSKTWTLKYLMNPIEFVASESNPNFLSKTIFKKNKIEADADGKYKIVPGEETCELKNDLVILSIGYKGTGLRGFESNGISFNEGQNRIVNGGGRIISPESQDPKKPIFKPGFYTSGWIKNGPKGVIASTMMDSFDTGENVIQDLTNNIHTNPKHEDIEDKLALLQKVDWEGWLKINHHELEQGKERGKTREKVCSTEEMIEISCK